ncbi:DoxX family membrane protein [Pontibacter sp. H249]|uniref:DoxX family membrane protein n=1 Tax=Pontibacter sp. H249 TaxID=3133420 RepID=UPI0030C21451
MVKTSHLLLVLIRLFLGYLFFSAGVCKLTGGNFGQLMGPPWLEEALAKHGLGLFAQVVAISQVIIGALLMSQRYSLLGAIMLVPMNVAILAVTVSQNWAGTPYVNSVFLALNLVLLLMERQKFAFLVNPMATHTINPALTDKFGQNMYSWIGLVLCLFIIVAARYNLMLTNVLATFIFFSFALTILSDKILGKLDRLLFGLPFLAMLIVTFANLTGLAVPALLVILAAEAILLGIRIYSGNRSQDTSATGVVAGNV